MAKDRWGSPAAGFGGVELYPNFVDKAAVLLVRLAKNHPLPDGNKRAAWVSTRMFVEVNGWRWSSYPDIGDAESAVLAISRHRFDEAGTAAWLRRFLAPPEQG